MRLYFLLLKVCEQRENKCSDVSQVIQPIEEVHMRHPLSLGGKPSVKLPKDIIAQKNSPATFGGRIFVLRLAKKYSHAYNEHVSKNFGGQSTFAGRLPRRRQ